MASDKHALILEQLSAEMQRMGLEVSGDHPILDGKWHRVHVTDDSAKEISGAYRGFDDGRPNAMIYNHRSGEQTKWVLDGPAMSDQERNELREQSERKRRVREAELQQERQAAAMRAGVFLREQTRQVVRPTPYMVRKDIQPHRGARTDEANETLFIPIYDIDGRVSTMQSIYADGEKKLMGGGEKSGMFHVIGGRRSLEAPDLPLIITEGYATGSTLTEMSGYPIIVCIDAGNIAAVASKFREAYPDRPMLIAADDDRAHVFKRGNNRGVEAAQAAAATVQAAVMVPQFMPGEGDWPASVPLVTPDQYKNRRPSITEAQWAAFAEMKRYTDFNDLATQSLRGRMTVATQMREGLHDAQALRLAPSPQAESRDPMPHASTAPSL
jgi:putative DNA primase/helicase